MHISLANHHILVTGASRGIGKAIARQLLLSGAKVVAHYSQTPQGVADLIQEFPSQVLGIAADLARIEDCENLFQTAINQLGFLNGLVNNAGIALKSPMQVPDHQWFDDWNKTLQVNLTASAWLARKLVNHCLANQQIGRLVHISSRAGFRGDTAEYVAYAASKAGMITLSHSLARAYGKQGIRSFVIAPGFTQTDMAQDFIDEYGADYASKDIALEKLTQPEDIAYMTTLLLSGLADHATASTITINAGSYVH
ncbi:MAG: SDR family oxidoreductase [Microscillaceae bacterium]|jgi:NAD(P)-dependent dehydrogenase (short-subunit alcohol dehydrogenase family)|nr:SDR family oxidoreductase [Microscillaceae bacterium]